MIGRLFLLVLVSIGCAFGQITRGKKANWGTDTLLVDSLRARSVSMDSAVLGNGYALSGIRTIRGNFTADTVNAGLRIALFPTGWDTTNTAILSFSYRVPGDNAWYTISDFYNSVNGRFFSMYVSTAGVYIMWQSALYSGARYKMVIARIRQ